MSGAKTLQRIVRDQSLKRLGFPPYAFVRDAVSLEIGRVEGQQISVPFSLQIDDDCPKPIERVDDLAAVFEREIDRLAVTPILETEKAGHGGQRQKRCNHRDERSRKPSQKMAPS